ncbi:MAG: hypothetical protein ABMB14_07320 [Myxococcota bacterium]
MRATKMARSAVAAIPVILTLTGTAAAGPCDDDGGRPVGPTAAALWDGGLGQAHRACPRTEVGLAPRGYLLVDTPAFYGRISADVAIDGSVAVDATEVRVHLEPLRYEDVISALSTRFVGYGYTAVGVTHRIDGDAGGAAVAVVGDVVLPTAIGLYGHQWPFAWDLAVAADQSGKVGALHGQLGLVGSAAAGLGATQLRTGFAGTVGAGWQPSGGFGLGVDVQAAAAYTAVIDHVAVAPTLRFGVGAWGLELAGAVPVAGHERALAVAELHSTVRF